MTELYRGDIVYAERSDKLCVYESSYIAVEDGKVEGIYEQLPEKFSSLPVTDFGRGLIIPAFSDLHTHASQFVQRGIGMDLLLKDWLNTYTFPQESRFADPEYAEAVYEAYTEELIRNGTFHAAIFATIHRPATNILCKKLEEKGLWGLVGKVNMDYDSPSYLCETAEESLRETEIFLEEHSSSPTVRPILTPRFVPTCSRELIWGLGKLGKKYGVGMQTHIVESQWEAVQWKERFSDCTSDANVYERAGLLDNGPAIFAHFIYPTEEDMRIMNAYDCYAVHCPDSNLNIIAGLMAVDWQQKHGVKITLGSDIGGGQKNCVFGQCSAAIQLSKLKELLDPETGKTIDITNAFYMATKMGGSVFGKVGSLEPGYVFNALVLDGIEEPFYPLPPVQRLERFCYNGDDRNITARFLNGKKL